jgi:hypothetical protein
VDGRCEIVRAHVCVYVCVRVVVVVGVAGGGRGGGGIHAMREHKSEM